jgi:hypothetical protein
LAHIAIFASRQRAQTQILHSKQWPIHILHPAYEERNCFIGKHLPFPFPTLCRFRIKRHRNCKNQVRGHSDRWKGDDNMKSIKQIFTLSAAAVLVFGVASAQSQSGSSTPVQKRAGIVDANGDGICDITGRVIGSGAQAGKAQQAKLGNRKGPGDGTGNQGNGPKDGTGYGSQSGKRTGPQDGIQAPMGRGNRSGAGSQSMGNRRRFGGRR